MTDDPQSAPPAAAGVRDQRRARRDGRIARRERFFELLISGHTYAQIARMAQTSIATVRRDVDRALAERRLDAPERFTRIQIARLQKALKLAEAAIELGELKAIGIYLRAVAALDRYHELAAGPPPFQRAKAPPLALPAPPKALTFATPENAGEAAPVDEAGDAAKRD
jgi:DNA-binding CsgD family transcriptional regulator